MSPVQHVREFISQRLASAAEEIFRVFERTIVQYEAEIERQQRLLNISWKPQRNFQRSDLLRQYLSKKEEVPVEQHLFDLDQSSGLNQGEPESPQVNKEHDELCTALEEDQLRLKRDTEAFVVQQGHSGPEPTRDLVFSHILSGVESRDQEQRWCRDSASARREMKTKERNKNTSRSQDPHGPEPGQTSVKVDAQEQTVKAFAEMENPFRTQTDVIRHYVPKEEEISEDQLLHNQDRSSSLDQEEPELTQIKEEQKDPESLQIKEERVEQLVLKEEIDAFMVTSAYEESDESQSEPFTNQNYLEPGSQHRDENCPEKLASTSHTDATVTPNLGYNYTLTNESWSNTETGQRSSECQLCGKVFEKDMEMKEHYKLHTGEKSLTCSVCGKVFKYNVNLLVHMRTHTAEKPYSCEICGKCFSQKVNLSVHMRTHTGEKPYLCKTCGMRFSDSSGFKRHTTIHTGEKPFTCKTCTKTFRYNVNLLVHMRTHTDERPYFCKTCGRTFSDPSTLRKHIITHTGAKSYSCQICGKCFTDNSNLLRHMRTHTGEKPYSCEICGKNFSQSSNLMQHIRTHTGEKPYPCGICDKSYSHSCTLLKHMRSHTGEKPYSCETCGRCFSHKCTLLNHTKIHTNKVQS